MWGPLGANGTPLGTIKPLELSGAPDQELMEQRAGGHSRSRAFGPPEQVGPLKKTELRAPQWRPWVMVPLEQAGTPDQEPMEPDGANRGSRSKDNRPLQPGALNQESMGALWMP